MRRILYALLLSSFALSGCESIQEIDRAAGELAKEMKAKQAEQARTARRSGAITYTRSRCEATSGTMLVRGLDPDLAYLRLKRFFGFHTWAEAKHAYPSLDWLKESNYMHDALPGVRYEMREGVTWPSTAYGPVKVWLNLVVEKAPGGTRITWSHCAGTDGWQKLGDPERADRHLREDIARVARGQDEP